MDNKTYQNKQMVTEKGSDELLEYHFPGEMKYVPMTIRAKNREEAEAIWEKERVEVKN